MIRYKDISIPKPCSVDYDSLPGDEIKRFCGSCEKYVYDFTGKDEVYLNEIFRTTGKVCGIYYEDQIQASTIKTKHSFYHSFYHSFVTKLIGINLFLKTFFTTAEADAVTVHIEQTTQTAIDSTGVKTEFKNRPYTSCNYDIDIFINGHLYKSNVDVNNGFIYLPDAIRTDDKITVIVKRTKVEMLMPRKKMIYKVRHKKYNFDLKQSDTIVIEVSYKKSFTVKRKRRLAGVPTGFW